MSVIKSVNTSAGTLDIDTGRVRDFVPNKDGKTVLTYTLVFDGAHGDTNKNGQPVRGAEVGEHGENQKVAGNMGNRLTVTRDEADSSGLLADLEKRFGKGGTPAEPEESKTGKTK
jgi:hypothetical protein